MTTCTGSQISPSAMGESWKLTLTMVLPVVLEEGSITRDSCSGWEGTVAGYPKESVGGPMTMKDGEGPNISI